METDQAEQVDALLNQSTNAMNKNCDTEETDSLSLLNRTIGPLHSLIVRTLKQK